MAEAQSPTPPDLELPDARYVIADGTELPHFRVWANRVGRGLPNGPWNAEPDKATWVDPVSDLDCLIHRGPMGALCGYVGVGPDHRLHGADYLEPAVEIHGGLTYSDACDAEGTEAHGICHVPVPGRPHDVWWFGFDCAHSGDLIPGHLRAAPIFRGERYWTFDDVVLEVTSLARQLVTLG